MARKIGLAVHRSWEDWALLGLGILIILSPWIVGQTSIQSVLIASTLIGLGVMILAQFELVGLRRSQEFAQLVFGAGLIALPFVLGYDATGLLRVWHFALGLLVALLAVFELWQDWQLDDDELTKTGQ
jgi:hypothetical protein